MLKINSFDCYKIRLENNTWWKIKLLESFIKRNRSKPYVKRLYNKIMLIIRLYLQYKIKLYLLHGISLFNKYIFLYWKGI